MTEDDSPSSHPGGSDSSEHRYEHLIEEHQSIPDEIREQILRRDEYRCQINGCLGTERGGTARLLVLPRDESPTHTDRHAPSNLEARCCHCSRWIAQMPSRDDLEPVLRDRLNGVEIEPTWAEILEYLADHGPATTGEITEGVSLSSTVGVRRALYALMGIDTREPDVTNRIVVKNRVTDEYGLPWQAPEDRRARGTLPHSPTKRRGRILDEIVRRLYEQLPDELEHPRELIAAVVDRDPHQTYHMKQRAEAFRFPFEHWADTKRPRSDTVAVIEAVDVLAGATENVSPQLLSRTISEVFQRNDEPALAELLEARAEGGDLQRVSFDDTESHQRELDDLTPEADVSSPRSRSGTDAVTESEVESDQNADAAETAAMVDDDIIDETYVHESRDREESGDWVCSFFGD